MRGVHRQPARHENGAECPRNKLTHRQVCAAWCAARWCHWVLQVSCMVCCHWVLQVSCMVGCHCVLQVSRELLAAQRMSGRMSCLRA